MCGCWASLESGVLCRNSTNRAGTCDLPPGDIRIGAGRGARGS